MRYLLECSYKGTEFHGWQIQPNAISVQECIEKGLSTILKKKIEITGSSRTDAGVHAAQQFAHFDLEEPIQDIGKLVNALNGILSKGIAIKDIRAVKEDFHSRFDATHRRYLYRILQKKNPFWHEISYFYKPKLDLEAMNKAGKLMEKYIDFQCFSKVNTDVQTFNCKIEFAYWEQNEYFLFFHVKADRFLRGMVRAIVGTMIDVGLGKLSIEGFEAIIVSKDRNKAGRAVPPEGLTLMEVGY
ncbi:tRNA pseudouridine synthase A [Emticicia oligotrophica DSM 17448]|uniref:tRNA pseudouridine synthase A n=1 Tax=Emticicia oligotrophica (strain DSM 17448 / CIP 109782 / MTCC 6937 / GPTSA100-15) TaxID=929562 RepID=A0ABN4ASU1_EMTOG|nr:tRNA pseudouridine(38-40) synthase TruA [Emticicia oligotrophica]AFK04881.1 tRNA pseudouridine synthase A [Emticicia oligotrophica DSM 17448]